MIKVLIVEDEPLVARMYQKTLAFDGFKTEIANGGSEALEKVKDFEPDLVLLDVMMPEPNGIQVLEKLKADSETKKIPVIVLTNLAGSQDTELALSKGAAAYWVKKETEPKQLGGKIREILKIKNGSSQAETEEEKPEEKKKVGEGVK